MLPSSILLDSAVCMPICVKRNQYGCFNAKTQPNEHASKYSGKIYFQGWLEVAHLAMGQNPVPPVNITIPTKIASKMGGEFTYPKMGSQNGFDNHSHLSHAPSEPLAAVTGSLTRLVRGKAGGVQTPGVGCLAAASSSDRLRSVRSGQMENESRFGSPDRKPPARAQGNEME